MFRVAVLMFQKEFADRLGIGSFFLQIYLDRVKQ